MFESPGFCHLQEWTSMHSIFDSFWTDEICDAFTNLSEAMNRIDMVNVVDSCSIERFVYVSSSCDYTTIADEEYEKIETTGLHSDI